MVVRVEARGQAGHYDACSTRLNINRGIASGFLRGAAGSASLPITDFVPTLLQSITHDNQTRLNAERSIRCELNADRIATCNRAARILRRLGFHDAEAEQGIDHGRRDVKASFMGHRFIVGVHWDGSVACLHPLSQYHGAGWAAVRRDLSDLPGVVRRVLSAALRHGLKQATQPVQQYP